MYPFQNILFSTDFSVNSKSALKYAAALARRHNATIFIHNAQEGTLPPQALKLSDRTLAEHGYDWVTAIKREMEEIANSELLNGLEVQLVLTEGKPVEEILRVVKEYHIDLAILGTSAKSGLSRLFVGSTALAVMSHADCSVLLVRQAMHDFVYHKGDETTIALNRILLATDLSEHDKVTENMAFQLAKEYNAELTVVHSLGLFLTYLKSLTLSGAFDVEERVRSEVDSKMKHLVEDAVGIEVETILTEGKPYEEIVKAASEKEADLIVIGAGRANAHMFTAPGVNTERVVRDAPCPVLVVKSVKP